MRPGVYAVTFTLAGFSTVKREGIELTTGFTAPVNAELWVGAITETVTVLPYSVQVSGTMQSVPGPALSASWTITSATVALVEPNTMYGDRLNQTDLRIARIFRHGTYRFQGMVDLYNLLNANPVLAYNTTFGTEWLRPLTISD